MRSMVEGAAPRRHSSESWNLFAFKRLGKK